MKRGIVSIAICSLVICAPIAMAKTTLKTKEDKISYALGVELGDAFKTQGMTIIPEKLADGMNDALSGAKFKIERDEIDQVLIEFRKDQIAKQEVKINKMAAENAQLGQTYREKKVSETGVKTTATGLQYKVITSGKGAKPAADDLVTVNYEGKFIDGQVFDSSYKRGEPAQFRLNQVIPGWTEALQLMSEGSTWELVLPPELAYGEHGMGGVIGPNETLVFKVELIKVNNDKKAS